MIVVIDDDQDIREIVTFALESEGYLVIPFKNSMEALAELRKQKDLPELLLVDYLMPQMDGLTFIDLLRKDFSSTLGRVPVIIMSGMGTLDPSVLHSKDISYLQKPMELTDLLKVVRQLLKPFEHPTLSLSP